MFLIVALLVVGFNWIDYWWCAQMWTENSEPVHKLGMAVQRRVLAA